MKWKKLGRIFNPIEHKLNNDCKEYAQAPQVLVFENFVRIYFSTRKKDQSGKYLSYISFVEMDKSLEKIRTISENTIIELGEIGCFDEHGIFPLNVLQNKEKVYGYISGISRRISVPYEVSIGLAISSDNGLTFTRINKGPILTASLQEPFLIGDPFVKIFNDIFHMWYLYGTKWIENAEKDGSPSRVYKIGHAISSDGINWKREGKQLITDKLNQDECQALPTVIEINNKYHMYFCYREAIGFRKNKDAGYRIGYACSEDLKSWTRDDKNAGIDVSEKGWDSEMMCYPHVFQCDDKIYMLYNGNEFGRFGFGLAILEEN